MGNICCCCQESGSYEDLTPDVETRRRQQMEAADKRIAEQQNRGIKNIEAVQRIQRRDQERERAQEVGNMGGQSNLKWQVS